MLCPGCLVELSPEALAGNGGRCPSCGTSCSAECRTTESWTPGETPAEWDQQAARAEHLPSLGGRFESLERIGAGGFGSVYKAFDSELRRCVALKIPHATRLLDRNGRERFLREARHLAQLRHPGILPIYDVNVEHDSLLLVTEYLSGETLSSLLRKRRLAFDESARLCIELAESLHHAHDHGIVHRDVKPSNVMIDPEGKSYLMDFGLAKQHDSDPTLSVDGSVIGTPAYMSPEQASGHLAQVDRRSDVYGLGVVLYEMLTGELPFRGEPHLVIYQVLHDDPPRPRSLNDRIPPDLELVCLKAISKQPDERYDTARSFSEDLSRYLDREPVKAGRMGWTAKALLWCRRRERIGQASTIATAMFVMLACWELLSLTLLSFDLLPVENRLDTAVVLLSGLVTFSTLAVIAYVARSRILVALWFGFLASGVLLMFSLSCFSGVIRLDGLSSAEVRIPVFSFFTIAASFILVAHVISLTAYYANRDVIRWSKQLPR